MKKLILLISAFFALACSFSVAADNAGVQTLEQKHGASWPKSPDGFVTKNQCMQCHGDYAKLAEKTASLVPNPHKSHLGNVNCEDCHKPDQAKPVLMCNECHNFTLQKK